MSDTSSTKDRSLAIVHVLRSPLGGLFRHVVDLAREQVARGHRVGLVADSTTGGPQADAILAELEPTLELGLSRFPMHRDPHVSDVVASARVLKVFRNARPDVVHGHGSKGALYARLPGLLAPGEHAPIRVYTPHGGSLHFAPGTLKGKLIFTIERLMSRRTDLVLFESDFAAERFRASIGPAPGLSRTVLNGLDLGEFQPVIADADAADFLYVGELRALKGVDIFLDAFAAACARSGRVLRAALVGTGADRAWLEARVEQLGLAAQVAFLGPYPAREAFRRGRTLVVPSRAESLPYIVLEAAGAQIPMIATRVGGIPEIFGPLRGRLVPSEDVEAMADAMLFDLAASPHERAAAARHLADVVRARFSITAMVDGVLEGYRDAMALKATRRWRASDSSMTSLSASPRRI